MVSNIEMDLYYDRKDPLSVIFCYPISENPFTLKGGLNQLSFILEKLDYPCFVNKIVYSNGQRITDWKFYDPQCVNKIKYLHDQRNIIDWKFYGLKNNLRIYVEKTYRNNNFSGFKITAYTDSMKCVEIGTYRTLPNAFPKKVKNFINKTCYK